MIFLLRLVTLITPNAPLLRASHFAFATSPSNLDSYILRTNEPIDYLTNRGYDKTFLKSQIQVQRASNVPRTDALKDKPIIRTKTTPFVTHIIQHYLTSRTSFTSIPMYSTHQIVVEMFLKTFR